MAVCPIARFSRCDNFSLQEKSPKESSVTQAIFVHLLTDETAAGKHPLAQSQPFVFFTAIAW